MATEKDFVKRIVKEMVDYFLYHELYDVTAHVVYVPHEKATITCTAPYTKLPEDLDLLEAGLSVEKHLELDSMYSSLMGSHNRDKNYCILGQCIDDYDIEVTDETLKIIVERLF